MNSMLTASLAVATVTITLAAMSSSVAFEHQDDECEERITGYSDSLHIFSYDNEGVRG